MVNAPVIAALFCALAGGIGHAQTERYAFVSGIVTDAVTRLPIQGVDITVRNEDQSLNSTHSEADGSYRLRTVPGAARIWAGRIGYLRPERDSQADLHDGDTVLRDFQLRPMPRISGTITDADTGKRLVGCIVFAMRRIVAMGEVWYTSAGIPTTGVRDGTFESDGTFETVGLLPGEYVLEITRCDWSFYPGVSRIEMATPLSVTEAGITGLGIKISKQRRRLSGGTEQKGADVLLVRHLQGETQVIAQTRSDANGQFEFSNVPEGEFHLITSGGADERIDVTDHDVAGVQVKPRLGVMVATSVRMLDDNEDTPATAQAELAPVFDRGTASRLRSTTVPGDYWPRLGGLTDGFTTASVLLNNAPLPNGSLTIDGGSPQLTFLVTRHFGTVTGRTVSAHASVIAIREPFSEYLDQAAQPRTESNDKGVFRIRMAPGKYKVFALSDEEELLARNEKFLRSKATAAESIEVGAESTCSIVLP